MENKVDMLLEPAREFLVQVGVFLPRLALAAAVIFGGWLAAKIVRFAIERALRAVNVNVLAERSGMDGFLQQAGVRIDTVGIFGWIGYWLVILAALMIGFNGLGLTYITDLLRLIVLFVPHVIVALLILAFGAYFARIIGAAVTTYCQNIGIQDAETLGSVARTAIIVFIVLIALDQVSVGGAIVRESFLIILAGVVFGLALAFGLAGRRWAAEMLERWWPLRRENADRSDRNRVGQQKQS
ncbi:MAG: hypothetical protein EHM59_17415 [Betaproteobacteria bacterium]|nr:MAG: hypothetical protein EHM59_17415 [Betaproteobacteria bacterium]